MVKGLQCSESRLRPSTRRLLHSNVISEKSHKKSDSRCSRVPRNHKKHDGEDHKEYHRKLNVAYVIKWSYAEPKEHRARGKNRNASNRRSSKRIVERPLK